MKITEITENINFYDRFGHDTGAQALPYTVEVRDRETGGKKLISIQAVSAADARERARDRGYRVVRVVSQDDSQHRKNMREHDGRDDEPEETDDDGRTMADRARRDGRGGDDEPETAAQRRKRSLQATRDFNRGRRADSMREGVAEGSTKKLRWGYHIVNQKTGNSVPSTPKFKTRQEAYQYLKTNLASQRADLEVDEFQMKEDVAEGGPFSYGAKKPRKGSVADLADKKRREQEQGKQPVEPRDQQVGVAKVTKGVAEGDVIQGPWSGMNRPEPGERYAIVRTRPDGTRDFAAGHFDSWQKAKQELQKFLKHELHTELGHQFEIVKKKGVSEGSETITLKNPFHKKVVVDDIELIARSSGNNDLNITAFSASEPGDTPIAQAKFWKEGSHLFSEKTFVSQSHQRKGIATLMYQFVKSLGFDIRPSKEKTELGQTLWRGFASKDSLSKKSIAQKFKPGVSEGPITERSKDYYERERAADAIGDLIDRLRQDRYKNVTPDVIRQMRQWVNTTGRARTIYGGENHDRFGSAGELLDMLGNRYRELQMRSGQMPEFQGRANTARDMAQQIAQQTRGEYEYNRPRTWTTGAGQRYRDPQDYIRYPDEQSLEDARQWLESRGQKVYYRDNFGNLNTAIRIGRYVVEPASITRGAFSDNPETEHRMSVRSAAAINQSVRSQVDITDQQAAALKDIAATRNATAMAGLQAMMAILKGEEDLKRVIDSSKKIDPRDKAKLDAIIAAAGRQQGRR